MQYVPEPDLAVKQEFIEEFEEHVKKMALLEPEWLPELLEQLSPKQRTFVEHCINR